MVTTDQEQPAPQQQEEEQPQRKGQAPAGKQDLNTLLQAQIEQAIQPVLADFRQQIAHSLQTQVDKKPAAGRDGEGSSEDAKGVLPERPQSKEDPAGGQASQQAEEPGKGQQPQEGPEAESEERQSQEQPEAQSRGEQPQEEPEAQSEEQPQEQPEKQSIGSRIVPTGLRTGLDTGLRLVERQGEQWLQSMVVSGLEALLAESAHAAVQNRAEKGLHTVLQKAFDALPNSDSATARDLLDQTERTLQAILRGALNGVFAEDVRGTLLDHGKQASSELAHAHVGGAMQQIEQILQILLQKIVDVLRQQWQRILRLLLRLVLTALQDSLLPEEGESPKALSAETDKEKSPRGKRGRQSKESPSSAEEAK